MKRFLIILIFISICVSAHAKSLKFLEKHFNNNDDKYVIYVNKKDKKLLLVDRKLQVVKEYSNATGTNTANKLFGGDNCTPEGTYKITQIWEDAPSDKLLDARENIKLIKKGSKNYKKAKERLDKMESEYSSGRTSLKRMNSVVFRAAEGHSKWGTKEDLGTEVYGPVFMRLSFPNEEDKARYREAVAKGEVPKGKNGKYKSQGSGIAIHGTNDPDSIGNNASSGCVRLDNRNVVELRNMVDVGTVVVIEK